MKQPHLKPPEWDPDYELAVSRLASELGYKPRTIHTLIRLGILDKSNEDVKTFYRYARDK